MKALLNDELEATIRRLGKSYTPALLPSDIIRGKLGFCFDTSVMVAFTSRGKYRYVEGMAQDPAQDGKWILHGWVTDGVHAFDPTWQALDDNGNQQILPVEYIGIELPMAEVLRFMRKTGYQGVLANQARWQGMVDKMLDSLSANDIQSSH